MFGPGLLRKRLIYPRWFYYYAIAQDTVLRFTWTLTISVQHPRLVGGQANCFATTVR